MAKEGTRIKENIVIADIASIRVGANIFGHYGKIAQMYINMFKGTHCVKIAGGPIYKGIGKNTILLPYDHSLKEMKGSWGQLRFKLRCIANGIHLFSKVKNSVIICQPYSFASWMTSIIFSPQKSKVYLIEYKNELSSKANRFLFKIAKRKIDGVLCPSKEVGEKYQLPYFCVTDYVYDKSENPTFEEKCDFDFGVFGIMSSGKDVMHVIRTFAGTRYRVLIAGFCGGRYEEFMKESAPNITIIDKYLSDEEYSSSIQRTKIVILPYKDDYKNQSSGVVFDVLFRGKPVLTRKYDTFRFIDSCGIGETYVTEINEVDLDAMVKKAQSGEYYEQIKKFIAENKLQVELLEKFIEERGKVSC